MNWKVINVYRGDNQIKKRKQNPFAVTVWFQTASASAITKSSRVLPYCPSKNYSMALVPLTIALVPYFWQKC